MTTALLGLMTEGELKTAEVCISRSKDAFIEVGAALLDIRDRKGYRFEYKTFEQYVRQRWGWSGRHGYQLIEAAAVMGNVKSISQNGHSPSATQALQLAPLAPDAQREIAGQVDFSQTSVRDLRDMVRDRRDERRAALREANAEMVKGTPTLPVGTFATIVIDPPWDWGDEGDDDQFGRGRPTYKTMPFDEILALPVGELAAENAHLYLWITNRSLPKGFALVEQWGFRYITCLTWCKVASGMVYRCRTCYKDSDLPEVQSCIRCGGAVQQFVTPANPGMGNYFRGSSEQVLFGVKGSLPLLERNLGTWFAAPRGAGHSSKPAAFYGMVEKASPGPWLDLFARQSRPGWQAWGAELAH